MTTLQVLLGALAGGGCSLAALASMPVLDSIWAVETAQPEQAEAVDVLLTKPQWGSHFRLQVANGVGITDGQKRAIRRIEDIIVKAQMTQPHVDASPDGHALIAEDLSLGAGQIIVWPCWLDADEYFVMDEVISAKFISNRHIKVSLPSGRFVIDVDRPEKRIAVKTRFKHGYLVMNDNGEWAGITYDNRLLSGSTTDRLGIENDAEVGSANPSYRIAWIRNGEFLVLNCNVDGRTMVKIYRPNGEFTGSEIDGYALAYTPIGSDTLFIERGKRRYRLARVNDNGEFEMLNWWSGNNRGLVRPFAVSPSGRMVACWKEGFVPGASSAVIRKTDVGEVEDDLPEYPKGTRFAAWLRRDCEDHSP